MAQAAAIASDDVEERDQSRLFTDLSGLLGVIRSLSGIYAFIRVVEN
jgi:hypothetical protein